MSQLELRPIVGATYTPTRVGSKAKPRTIVWNEGCPCVSWIHEDTIGWVRDPKNPAFPRTGHDSWFSLDAWRKWVKKHDAKILDAEDISR